MSEYDIAISGLVATWIAAVTSGAALLVALLVFAESQYRERRKQADAFTSAVWVDANVTVGAPAQSELTVHVENTNDTPIWLPTAFVPRDDGHKGYIPLRFAANLKPAALPAKTAREIVLAITQTPSTASGALIHFRDARNVWWLRNVQSGKYYRWLKKWWIEKQLRRNQLDPGPRKRDRFQVGQKWVDSTVLKPQPPSE